MPGTSPDSYGMNVARMASVPAEIVEHAEQVSNQFSLLQNLKRGDEDRVSLTRSALACDLVNGVDDEKLLRIWQSLQVK
jgi:DNA mismatch repair ATPase MutS